MSFNLTTGSTQMLADLSAYPVADFMAADTRREVAYAVLDNGTVLTVAFDGSSTTVSSGAINGSSDIVDLIVDENTGNLYALLEHTKTISHLASIELVKVDPSSGNTGSVMTNKTGHTYLMSSTFDFASSRYFVLLASEDTWELVTLDIGAGNMTATEVPYGLTAIAYSAGTDSIVGLVSMSPIGQNMLVVVDLGSQNVTTVGKAFSNGVCGATLAHGGYSATSEQYVTLCCDTSDCSNVATVTVIDATTNSVVKSVNITAAQVPVDGFYSWN